MEQQSSKAQKKEDFKKAPSSDHHLFAFREQSLGPSNLQHLLELAASGLSWKGGCLLASQ